MKRFTAHETSARICATILGAIVFLCVCLPVSEEEPNYPQNGAHLTDDAIIQCCIIGGLISLL